MPRRLSLKIGISGVRGVVGESLTPQLVTAFATAFGTHCGAGPVLIGTDSRPSRVMVKEAAIAGLLSVGCTPIDLGIVPAPTLQLHIRSVGAFGGVCVTASHNPIQWNALKFYGPDGIVLRPTQAAELTELYHQGEFTRVGSNDIAVARTDDTAPRRHRDAILAAIDVERIRARRFKIVVDCCNGAASLATPEFLRALGCEVVELNTDFDEPFPHHPEPLPEHIGDLCAKVRETGADMGFAQDADADRLAIVNERGEAIGEDCTIAMAIRHHLARDPRGPVVVNVSTSRMVDDVAGKHGVQVLRTKVGEVNVVQRMLDCGARIGGEGNGGVIVPAINPCRDSFVAMGMILEALATEGGTMGEMRGRIPTYSLLRERLDCPAREVVPCLRKLRDLYRGCELDMTDGLKVLWSDRWLLARASNTEPILRVEAEAPTESDTRTLLRDALDCLCPS